MTVHSLVRLCNCPCVDLEQKKDNEPWTPSVVWRLSVATCDFLCPGGLSRLISFQVGPSLYHWRSLHLVLHSAFLYFSTLLYNQNFPQTRNLSPGYQKWHVGLECPVPPPPQHCMMSDWVHRDFACLCPRWCCHRQWVVGCAFWPWVTCFWGGVCPAQGPKRLYQLWLPSCNLYLTGFGRYTLCSVVWDCDVSPFLRKQKVVSFHFLLAGVILRNSKTRSLTWILYRKRISSFKGSLCISDPFSYLHNSKPRIFNSVSVSSSIKWGRKSFPPLRSCHEN